MKHEASDESTNNLVVDDPEAAANIRGVAGFDRCRQNPAWDDVPTKEWPPHVLFRDRPSLGGRVLAAVAETPKRGRGRPRGGSHAAPHYKNIFPTHWNEQSARGWPASSIHVSYVWDSDAEHVPQSLRCRSTLCGHESFETAWAGQTECSLRCAEQMVGINHTEETRAAWLLAIKARAIAERRQCEPAPDRISPLTHIVVWRSTEARA